MGWPHWEPHFGARLLSICKRLCYLCIPLVGTCGDTSPKHDIENLLFTTVHLLVTIQIYNLFSGFILFRRRSFQMSDEPKSLQFDLYANFNTCTHTSCPVKCIHLLMLLVFFQFAKWQSRLKSYKRASVLFLSPEKKQRTSIIQKTICTFANATSPYGTGTPCT